MSEIKELTNQIKAITRNLRTENNVQNIAQSLNEVLVDLSDGDYDIARDKLWDVLKLVNSIAPSLQAAYDELKYHEYDNAKIMLKQIIQEL